MRVAVIPARGGSKRIARKNIRPFCGKPMIAWAIGAALASASVDRLIVSTDDDEIADVARELGAEVPFRRPEALSDDHAGTVAVVGHAVDWLDAQGESLEQVCCLYATAPFVTPDDLEKGLQGLLSTQADYSIAVTTFESPIQRALFINDEGRLEMFQPELVSARSQDLVGAYHDAGQFYWGRPDAWRRRRPILTSSAVASIIPRYRVQDIDTLEDWARAERMFRAWGREAA